MSNPHFDSENENRPYIAVNGVIVKKIDAKDHIILGKRKNVAGAGYYYLPGGHIKMSETISQTLVREMKEECGIDVRSGKCLWIEENLAKPHHITFYCGAIIEGNQEPKNMEPEKCEGWDWYPIENPPKPLWITLKAFLRKYTQKKINGINHIISNKS